MAFIQVKLNFFWNNNHRETIAENGIKESIMLTISQVETEEQIAAVSELFREYVDWIFTLAIGHEEAPTFEGLEDELSTLPGIYAPPEGRLLLAIQDGQPAGCICLKGHDAVTCELKRVNSNGSMCAPPFGG